ncbi:MAG: response regulator [Candidatus Riflebacteria bacterium]|nr:response regulator [Candidatus Riflebacteria bacterium]
MESALDPSARLSVLLVDDLPQNLLALEPILEGLAVELVAARSGPEALRCLLDRDFACIVMDVQMPDMDGFEVARLARARERSRLTPILFVTARFPLDVHALQGYEAGAVDYIVKPIVPVVLRSKVSVFVELARKDWLLRRQAGELRAQRDILAEANQRLMQERSQFFELASDLLCIGFDGRFVQVNPAWTKLFGFQPEELQEHPMVEFIHPDDREATDRAFASRREGPHNGLQNRHRCKDGSYRTLLWRWSVDSRRRLIYAVARDVTREKEIQERALQAQKLEAVGQLAGGVAHDFNNLLTVIAGHCELALGEEGVAAPVRESLEAIQNASQRASSLTRQLLLFSRQQIVQPRVIDLNRSLADLVKLLRRLLGEDIELVVAPAPDRAAVKMDPGYLDQIVINLAVNARDAMPDGGRLTIQVETVPVDPLGAQPEAETQPDRQVVLSISDTGCGMDPSTRARVFEPFFTTKEIGKGTGLGLSTVYGVVRQAGGTIEVQSEPGRGTSFRIVLPATDEAAAASTPLAARLHQGGSETILVVEDDAAVRKLLRRGLERERYTVMEASDGAAALELAARHPGSIHLLLTDMIMPGMSGIQLAIELTTRRPETRVLFASGYTDRAADKLRTLPVEVLFIQKPFTASDLVSKIREILGRGRSPAA